MTRLVRKDGERLWQLDAFNAVEHLDEHGAPTTAQRGRTQVDMAPEPGTGA